MDNRKVTKASWEKFVCVALICAGGGLSGCYEPLFSPEQSRSQYDRFDAVRDRRAPSYVFDEFGNRRPNIRGRLVVPE